MENSQSALGRSYFLIMASEPNLPYDYSIGLLEGNSDAWDDIAGVAKIWQVFWTE